ncbi:MAG: hypothetical protein CMH57_11490 [Myxococcales bacterium]|nr:hypothetical protein [Myxococcales bacterium]
MTEENERLRRTNSSMARDLRQMCTSHEVLQETLAVYRKAYSGRPAPGVPTPSGHTSLPSGIHRALARAEEATAQERTPPRAAASRTSSPRAPAPSRPMRQSNHTPALNRETPVSRTAALRTDHSERGSSPAVTRSARGSSPAFTRSGRLSRPARAMNERQEAQEAPTPYVSRTVRSRRDLERTPSASRASRQGPTTRRARVDRGLLSRATRSASSDSNNAADNPSSPGAMRFVRSSSKRETPRPSRPLQRHPGALERPGGLHRPTASERPGGLHRPSPAERASGLHRPGTSERASGLHRTSSQGSGLHRATPRGDASNHPTPRQGSNSGYYRTLPRDAPQNSALQRSEPTNSGLVRRRSTLSRSAMAIRESGNFTSRSTQEISEAYSDEHDSSSRRSPIGRRDYWRED